MDFSDLISPDSVIARLKATSKKQALQELARRAGELTAVHERQIFEALLERERLGTTGVGNGIAIPHGKLPEIKELFGLFARLDEPVDFDAIDEQPVDLVFLLLAPEGAGADHLKALAQVARTPCRRRCRRRRGPTAGPEAGRRSLSRPRRAGGRCRGSSGARADSGASRPSPRPG